MSDEAEAAATVEYQAEIAALESKVGELTMELDLLTKAPSPRLVSNNGRACISMRGKEAVGAYCAKALTMMPELRFTLTVIYLGADTIALHYEGVRGPAS